VEYRAVTPVGLAPPAPALEGLPLLALLPPDLRELVSARFVPVTYSFGAVIVSEGEEADALYVLTAGRLRVLKRDERGEEISLSVLRPGESFGEMGLLERTRRTATVRASSDVEALRLDRAAFDELVLGSPDLRRHFELQIRHRALHNFFRQYSAFGRLPVEALRVLLAELEVVAVAAGETVIRQGDPTGPMYVVQEGRLRTRREDAAGSRDLGYLRPGDFFGELSLMMGQPRAASVEAITPSRLLRLAPGTFRMLLRDHPAFRSLLAERIAQYDYRRTASVPLDFARELLPAEVEAHDKVGPGQVEAALDGAPEPTASAGARRKRIRRVPHVAQIDERDCGAAALATVCRHFGRRVSLTRIRQLVHTASDGTSLRALCRAAETLGLAARSVKASRRHLAELPLPAIVHWDGNHWVVVYDVDATHVRLSDPAVGLRRLTRAEFEAKWTGYAALFDYTEAFASAPEGRPSAAWLWPFVRPWAGVLVRALALAGLVAGLQMLLPVFTQVIVDRVLVEQDAGLLRVIILAMLGVLTLMVASMAVQRYLLSFVAVRVDAATLDFLTRRLLALPTTYFGSRRTGDIQRRLAGTRQVREFLVQHGVAGLTAAVQFAAAVTLMVVYSPILAGVFVLTAPLYAALMRLSARWLRPTFQSLEEGFGRYFSHQIDAIRGIETVKALGAEGTFRQLMLEQFHGVARRLFRADLTMMGYDGAVQVVTFLSLILFLWAGAQQVMTGALTIGALVAFNSLIALANGPISTLLSLWDNGQMVSVLLGRLDDVFEQEPEQGADHAGLIPVRTLEGRLEFRHVSFRYGGPESPLILDDISFEVAAGKRVAIVGRSGSGKTTMVKCLGGLLEPSEGTILFDGVDFQKLDHQQLRQHIGFVLQDTYVFDETIARNIALGDEESDPERVAWAARVASAHDFIERLPLGYDTRIGDSGVALSGGQRQRIAIARAIYRRPPVLVFDEATSALDTESERAIKENLDQLAAGRTAFVIAHRLSTIRDADVILVLEAGKLVERGTHDDLMRRRGLYYYLVSQQLEL
jgi:HlyB family type I secretion system ABC transporter